MEPYETYAPVRFSFPRFAFIECIGERSCTCREIVIGIANIKISQRRPRQIYLKTEFELDENYEDLKSL